MGGERGTCGGEDRCIQGLVGKPEKTRSLRRTMRRWEDNIKMDLHEVEWGHGLDLSGLGWGQVAGSCEHGNEVIYE